MQFEYVGRSAITAIGPVTGRRYSFTVPGARVAVDLRDRHALTSVPSLRQLHELEGVNHSFGTVLGRI